MRYVIENAATGERIAYRTWRNAYRATETTLTLDNLPPCVELYQPHRRAWLVSIIESLTEELDHMPRHEWNAVKVADREKAIAGYRDALSRLDAAASSERPR